MTFRLVTCLIGAHFIILTGEKISTFEAFTIKSYYPTLLINYLIALILAWLVKRATVKLDRYCNWEDNLWWRLILQLFFGVVVVSLICFLLVFIYFRSFGQSIMASNYPTHQFPIAVALLTVLNAFYVCYYFYHRVKILSAAVAPEGNYNGYIPVLEGKQAISLATEEVAYIYLVGKEVLVRTKDKKDYLCEASLDELETRLDPKVFFRINRQLIAHRSACKAYEPLEYGKLAVVLIPVPLDNSTVSQRKAGAFREWMK